MRRIPFASLWVVVVLITVTANLHAQPQQPAYWWSEARINYDGYGSGSHCFSSPEWGVLMEVDTLGWFSGRADSMTPLRRYPGMEDVAIENLRVLKNGTVAVLGFDSILSRAAVYVFDGPHSTPRIIDTIPLYIPIDQNRIRVVEPDVIIVNGSYSWDRGLSWHRLVQPDDTVSKFSFIDFVRSPGGRLYAYAAIYTDHFQIWPVGWFQKDDGASKFVESVVPPGTYDLSFLRNGRAIALTTENQQPPYVWFKDSDTSEWNRVYSFVCTDGTVDRFGGSWCKSTSAEQNIREGIESMDDTTVAIKLLESVLTTNGREYQAHRVPTRKSEHGISNHPICAYRRYTYDDRGRASFIYTSDGSPYVTAAVLLCGRDVPDTLHWAELPRRQSYAFPLLFEGLPTAALWAPGILHQYDLARRKWSPRVRLYDNHQPLRRAPFNHLRRVNDNIVASTGSSTSIVLDSLGFASVEGYSLSAYLTDTNDVDSITRGNRFQVVIRGDTIVEAQTTRIGRSAWGGGETINAFSWTRSDRLFGVGKELHKYFTPTSISEPIHIPANQHDSNTFFSAIVDDGVSTLLLGERGYTQETFDGTKTIVTGRVEGNILRSPDDGFAWSQTLLPGMGKWVHDIIRVKDMVYAMVCSMHLVRDTRIPGDVGSLKYDTMYVHRSSDFGITWSQVLRIPQAKGATDVFDMCLTSNSTGVVAALSNGAMYFINEGGTSWSSQVAAIDTTKIASIAYDSKDRLVAATDVGLFFVTTPVTDVWEGAQVIPTSALLLHAAPNPFHNTLAIELRQVGANDVSGTIERLQIVDVLGRVVVDAHAALSADQHLTFGNARRLKFTLDLNGLEAGTYFLVATAASHTTTMTLVHNH